MEFPTVAKSGFWLFSDQILAVIGGLVFWLIITNIATVSEVGEVSAILGVASIAGFLTFGLEYVILREASQKKQEVFGTFLILEIILLIAFSILVFFLFEIIFPSLSSNLFLIAALFLFLLGLWEFAIFSVIGLLRGKFVTVVHVISVTAKVLSGIIFLKLGLGSEGILLAILLHVGIAAVLFILLGIKEIGFQVVSLKKLWPLIKLAIGNYVSKIARIVTTSLTFLILPAISSDMSLAGIFFIHYTIATVTSVQPPGRWGLLDIRQDKISKFLEKPAGDGNWINGGFFVLEPKVFDYIKGDSTIWEKDPLEKLSSEDQLSAYKHTGFWQPIDTLREKNRLEELWNSDKAPWKTW